MAGFALARGCNRNFLLCRNRNFLFCSDNHVDLYRLEEPREALTLGLDEIFDRDAAVLIEWGERFPQILPAERIEIELRHAGGDAREILISGIGLLDRAWL